jgi:hypothetical protein
LFLVAAGVEGPEANDDEMSDKQEDFGHSMTINTSCASATIFFLLYVLLFFSVLFELLTKF